MMEDGYGQPWLEDMERRCGCERREYSLITVLRSLYGQRAWGRRIEDHIGAYVDRFEPRILLLGLVIITLCCADALFTLNLINSGSAHELNPVMRWTMGQCVYFFLSIKIGLTSLGLFVLLGLKNFYVFGGIKVSRILYGALICYALLIKYELLLHII